MRFLELFVHRGTFVTLQHKFKTNWRLIYLRRADFLIIYRKWIVWCRSTWCGQLQLRPPELCHGRLQLLDHKVVLAEEIFGQSHLQKLHQLLHGQLHQVLCRHTHTLTLMRSVVRGEISWFQFVEETVLLLCSLRSV